MQQKFSALQKIAREFNAEDITWAIGGSLLLYIRGLSDQFEDIDLIILERDALLSQRLLIKHGPMQPINPDEKYRTRGFFEFIIDEVDIDLMCVLSIMSDGIETLFPFDESYIERFEPFGVEQLPLMYLEDWYLIYLIIGREPKIALLDEYFAEHGFNPKRMELLQALEMSDSVRSRLNKWV